MKSHLQFEWQNSRKLLKPRKNLKFQKLLTKLNHSNSGYYREENLSTPPWPQGIRDVVVSSATAGVRKTVGPSHNAFTHLQWLNPSPTKVGVFITYTYSISRLNGRKGMRERERENKTKIKGKREMNKKWNIIYATRWGMEGVKTILYLLSR